MTHHQTAALANHAVQRTQHFLSAKRGCLTPKSEQCLCRSAATVGALNKLAAKIFKIARLSKPPIHQNSMYHCTMELQPPTFGQSVAQQKIANPKTFDW